MAEDAERLGRRAAQVLGERPAVGEQAVAAVGRRNQRMQGLETRHRFAVGIVGMQAEAQVRIGEIFRLRHGAHIEDATVIGLGHIADVGAGFQDRVLPLRHAAQEGDAVLQEAGQPVEACGRRAAESCMRQHGEVALRGQRRSLQPAANLQFGTAAVARGAVVEPGERDRRRARLILPVDCHRIGMQLRGLDAWLGGYVHDVDQPLAAVGVAVFGQIVAQPDAGELPGGAVIPGDAERCRQGGEARGNDGLAS